MNWNFLKQRWNASFGRRASPFILPPVVLEVESNFVAGARLDTSVKPPRLRRMAVRELEPRALEPLPNRPNIANQAEFRRALRAVAEVVGNGGGRFGLVVPDGTVRVAILDFETLPDDLEQVEALVRWRLRENLPFPPEEARISYQVIRPEPGVVELLVVAAKSSVVGEYETALEEINGDPILVLPATLALLPLIPEGEQAGQLLLHICSGCVTTVVVTGSRLRLWRTRHVGSMAPEDLAKDAAAEAARVAASSRDRLKIQLERVWLCERPRVSPEVGAALARAVSQEVLPLAPGADFAAELPPAEQAIFERFGATVAGLVSNPG